MSTETVTGRPVKPSEVLTARTAAIPAAVYDVFNDLIGYNMRGRSAIVKQDSAVTAICAALGIARHEAYDRGYLDVEPAYIAAGWEVFYDKPAFNEDYEAFFRFTAP